MLLYCMAASATLSALLEHVVRHVSLSEYQEEKLKDTQTKSTGRMPGRTSSLRGGSK